MTSLDMTSWDMTGAMLSKMREKTYLCDFSMAASDFDDTRELIVAHSVVMAASCSLFHQFLVARYTEFKDSENIIYVTEVDTSILKIAVDFVYGKIPTDSDSILALNKASVVLGMPAAKRYIEKFSPNLASDCQVSKRKRTKQHNLHKQSNSKRKALLNNNKKSKSSCSSISLLTNSPTNEALQVNREENSMVLPLTSKTEPLTDPSRGAAMLTTELQNNSLFNTLKDESCSSDGSSDVPNMESSKPTITDETTSTVQSKSTPMRTPITIGWSNRTYEEIENWSKLCNVCGLLTSNVLELNQHLKTSHNFKKCKKCSITLENNQLSKHRRNYHQTAARCRKCMKNKSFDSPLLLLEHILMDHHSDELYFCSLCAYNTIYHNQMVYHFAQNHEILSPFKVLRTMNLILTKHNIPDVMVLHNIVSGKVDNDNWKDFWLMNIFYCCYCSAVHVDVFSLSECIRQHLLFDRDELDSASDKVYACWKCDEKFVSYKQYQTHRKFHKEIFICDICGKIKYTLQKMREHNNIHTGLKPHKCKICDKSFRDPTTLKDHYITHSEIESFLCQHCGKGFKFRQSYQSHLKIVHDPNYVRPCACTLCPYRAHYKQRLDLHYEVVHSGKLFPCDVCGQEFKSTAKVRIHKKKSH